MFTIGIDSSKGIATFGLLSIICCAPSVRKKGPCIDTIVKITIKINFHTILWYLLFKSRYKKINGSDIKTLNLHATDNPNVTAEK